MLSCFFWILALFYNKYKIQLKDIPLFILCGIFGVAVNQLFFFHGLNLSSSFNSGIIMSMNPIMVGVLSYFMLKEKPTLMKIAGVLLGASGAILLTLKGAVGSGDSIIGDLFLIINAMSYALYLVLVKPLMSRYAPITVITWVFTFGLFFVCIFPSTIPDLLQTDFGTIPSEIYLKIVYIIVGVTFFHLFTHYLWFTVFKPDSFKLLYLFPTFIGGFICFCLFIFKLVSRLYQYHYF